MAEIDFTGFLLALLHHHHAEEDTWLWPTLRARAPHAAAALDRLEAQHVQVDPLIAAAADTTRPLPERAPVLAELHQAINAHLDEEELVVLPLCTAHVSAQEWEAFGERAGAHLARHVLGAGLCQASTPPLPAAACHRGDLTC